MIAISELYIYPVKSLGGISVTSADITERGFRYDRRWMVVDENNMFMTQRIFPAMALLKVAILSHELSIHFAPDANISIKVPLEPEAMEFTSVEVWGDLCKAQWVSKEADDWLSDILHVKCRLVFMPEDSRRKVDEVYASHQEITAFTDGYPFMMIGQASLDDLNNRLNEPLPINRFRPNMVFTGGEPYEEDLFEHFTIGEIEFSGVKLCARCTITTIDQQTGSKGVEPLKTLASYRQKNNKIYFGQNLLHRGNGVIRVGDLITVKKKYEV